MNARSLLVYLGLGGLAYAGYTWWKAQHANAIPVSTMPLAGPRGAPPAAPAIPGWQNSAGLAISGHMLPAPPPPPPPPSIGPLVEALSGRGHF